MLRLLCTADLHIGRYSTYYGEDPKRHPVVNIWDRLVDLAISGDCRALLIGGDFFDSRAAQYETRNRVKAGLERLRAENINVFAVAGNHDFQALPDFARAYPGWLHLFPANAWETVALDNILITGRSFTNEFQRTSLLDGFHEPNGGTCTIALLHADINAVASPYAPLQENMLLHYTGIAAWLVGHVHASRLYADGKALYPGSPQAMDFGETGLHGAYFLNIDNGRTTWSDLIPLSPITYNRLDLTLNGDEIIEDQLRAWRTTLPDGYQPDTVCHRLNLTSNTDNARVVDTGTYISCDNDFYRIERITPPSPPIDLRRQAYLVDASGQAARLLLGLNGIGEPSWNQDAAELIAKVQAEMHQIRTIKLNLDRYGEYANSLHALPDEAERAVRQILQRVLQKACGGIS